MSETYSGIKFKVQYKTKEIIQDSRILELKQWCNIFSHKKLAPEYETGSYGNLSFRVKPNKLAFIISGTQVKFSEKLSAAHFVKILDCDFEKIIIFAEGIRKPSSESMLHYAIYKKLPKVNAIFHGHSEIILQKSKQMNLLETEKKVPYGSMELVDSCLSVINQDTDFFVIKEHGFVALGKTMQEAGNISVDIYKKSSDP